MVHRNWQNKSTEDLLNELESTEEVESDVVEFSDDVVLFLNKYNIITGDKSVKREVLYKLYKTFSQFPLTKTQFGRIISYYLSSYSNKRGTWYKVNIDAFKINELTFKTISSRKVNKTRNKSYVTHFDDICNKIGLKKGNSWIEGYVIYEIYRKWCKAHDKTPLLGYGTLHDFLCLSFDFRRITSNRSMWFRITDDYKKYITEEEIQKIRKERGNKKKPKYVPRFGPNFKLKD